ncbi:hypothetical protein HHL28_15720 [Aerophototrophica crusticola]|uniref:Uncharacterized protein n=1 Tax=Aerophototrophica crusticola TaxID=1709002 RepID=A0A858R9K8_9PROT|nr:hypothetical protein HHL28_15720 [Rhodospirillaceae bacterium B3]
MRLDSERIHQELEREPRSIEDLYNPYKDAAQTWPAKEQDIELKDLLRYNFLQYQGDRPVPEKLLRLLRQSRHAFLNMQPDDPMTKRLASGVWYVPEPADQAEMERQREEHMWGEFQQYRGGGKKRFAKARPKAVRIGFGRLLDQGKEEELLALLQREWEPFLYRQLSPTQGGWAEGLVPFDAPEVRPLLDNLFADGLLRPSTAVPLRRVAGTWLAAGVVDGTASRDHAVAARGCSRSWRRSRRSVGPYEMEKGAAAQAWGRRCLGSWLCGLLFEHVPGEARDLCCQL